MRASAHKPEAPRQTGPEKAAAPARARPGPTHRVSLRLAMYRPLGNQAVPAAAGRMSASQPLPHLDAIGRSFGAGHDLSSVRAQVGGPAVGWNGLLGSSAFTRGERIAFSAAPSLDEAAHEAAHVVQQRGGARPPGGLSRAGDRWEREADAVAARVTRGESAADLLPAPAPPVSDADAPVQRRLIATGTDADFDRFRAMAETASGLVLSRDPATNVVTAIASSVTPATSPAFAAVLTRIMDDPAQDAEAQFGTHQAGVLVGAFPTVAPTVQIIDMDDVENVEAGAPGRGVAALAHELQENYTAHALPVGIASFGAAHAAGNVAEEAVSADLVGPGRELLEYSAPNPAGGSFAIEDYETYFVVIDFALTPPPPATSAPPDFEVTGARHVPQTVVGTFTVDNFVTGSDAVPVGAATTTAVTGVIALLTADPTAAVHVEGFTDDVGSAASNLTLGQGRANNGRALLGAAVANRAAALGRGETGFVAPNTSAANRALNRRIVFTVVRP